MTGLGGLMQPDLGRSLNNRRDNLHRAVEKPVETRQPRRHRLVSSSALAATPRDIDCPGGDGPAPAPGVQNAVMSRPP